MSETSLMTKTLRKQRTESDAQSESLRFEKIADRARLRLWDGNSGELQSAPRRDANSANA